jgi:ssDNA-binding Zn-finger/Zn-ribbon topoisomerase 1
VEIGSISSISHTHGHNAEEVIGGNDSLLSDEALKNTGREEIIPACAEEMSLINNQEDQEVSDNLVADNEHTPLLPEKNECALVSEEICGEDTTVSDDAIADRIAAFESNLAMKCPICRVNTLKEYTTAAGKVYYTCPAESCNFISWGKPHHTECGQCKNPFLVEVTDAAGKIILKCPRATCHHRQDLNTARKLVRKRLVRRRK